MLSSNEKGFAVTLRLSGPGIDPKIIEALIGLPATSMRIAGETWTSKSGKEYGPARENVWCHRLAAPRELGFEEQIGMLLPELERNAEFFSSLQGRDDVFAELFCGFSSGNGQGGDTLSADTLVRIASLGLSLSLDLYPPDIDENAEMD